MSENKYMYMYNGFMSAIKKKSWFKQLFKNENLICTPQFQISLTYCQQFTRLHFHDNLQIEQPI